MQYSHCLITTHAYKSKAINRNQAAGAWFCCLYGVVSYQQAMCPSVRPSVPPERTPVSGSRQMI
jgi:hypothetical protein